MSEQEPVAEAFGIYRYDPQLAYSIKSQQARFWKQHQARMAEQQKANKLLFEMRKNRPYRGPEVKLFCGHWIAEASFTEMTRAQEIRCPKCGMSWRGSMVIQHRKSLPKQELREAQQRAYQREKSRPKGSSGGRSNSSSR